MLVLVHVAAIFAWSTNVVKLGAVVTIFRSVVTLAEVLVATTL